MTEAEELAQANELALTIAEALPSDAGVEWEHLMAAGRAVAKHLLADPAQTTELEDLRRFADRDRQAALRRQAENEQLRRDGAKLLAVTEEFQWQRNLLLWLHAEAAWRVAGFDVLTVALARRNHQLTAERDERQASIEAALTLMDYWDAHGGSIPQGHRLRALLRGDQPPAEEPTPERVPCGNPDRYCGRRGGSAHCGGCRDDEPSPLSGEALRDVEERDDAAGDLP